MSRTKPSADGVNEEWKAAVLDAHNKHRKIHDAPPLAWSEDCYLEAKKQADACQAKDDLFHGHLEGKSGRHGQNAFFSSRPGSSADKAVASWYNEIDNPGYDFSNPGFGSGTGHFTQVVWKGSSHVGMAVSEDGCYVVANYWPAGNLMGSFEQNVVPPEGGRPFASESKPAIPPKEDDRKAADGSKQVIVATSMTAELEAAFDGCPFDFKDKAAEAFASGGSITVTVQCEVAGTMTTMTVNIKEAGGSRQMQGSWGH
eukprot:TRINITY_DN1594_c0_g2_i1.p1 TRINITY_DN1594_c0_g2~~TRINITY_DN1594_c0_g2_i1.p1  ORF type:complete len:257 (-),score=55.80 TRINITY_DN1594_c0_g2_i1:218-988(-)